ncbi:hypothetical protein [Streptomyces sp. NRRL F-2580]|uniref:hypothetical protein n=1 Tax=Streptomyces sp. NRRL F-2580 TaxID=1463841 RepID=UPI001F2FF4BB|nr:hypothetical protein [Streptomyces sp. NRRL F-2580]
MVLSTAFLTVVWWPRTEVTYRDSAPATVVYADDSPHFLGLVHGHTLPGRHPYKMAIGRDPSLSYRHWTDLDTTVAANGIESVTWTESGVRVRLPTGHEAFIPAQAFLHGR